MKKQTLNELLERLEILVKEIYNDSKQNEALEKYYIELADINNILSVELNSWNAGNGKSRTPEKILAARENGKKGGRPKKNKTESV